MGRGLLGHVGLFKVGSRLFTAAGPQAVRRLARLGADIFLDLKFHDIPHTVSGAVAAAAVLPGIRLLTLHAAGGLGMMRAARRAVEGKKRRPLLLGVTVLTSLDSASLRRVGIGGALSSWAIRLARVAQEAGLDGAVSSSHEMAAIRRACGKTFVLVNPGVRPAWAAAQDQSRIATPAEAIRSGADYLVVGRPITAAADPRAAAARIVEEIAAALRTRV